MKILVRAPNWIGDQLISFPFFYYLRQRYPGARITVLCVPWVKDLQFRNLIDEVIELRSPLSMTRSLIEKMKFLESNAKMLRDRGPWDLGFSLPNSFSSAWLLWRSGCATRVGYASEGRSWLLSKTLPLKGASVIHRAQAYVNLLELIQEGSGKALDVRKFWTLPAENELDPPIPGELDEFPAEQAWPHARPHEPLLEPYWVLAPGSMADSRRWGEEEFLQLARLIAQSTGWTGLILGGPKEAPVADRLKEDRSSKLKDWTARGAITDLWKLCRHARFVVANDSGMAHFSAILGSPTFIPWGAGDPRRTRPLGPTQVQMEVNAVDCWPCEKNYCVRTDSEFLSCIRGVHADGIWKQIQSGILRGQAGSSASLS